VQNQDSQYIATNVIEYIKEEDHQDITALDALHDQRTSHTLDANSVNTQLVTVT